MDPSVIHGMIFMERDSTSIRKRNTDWQARQSGVLLLYDQSALHMICYLLAHIVLTVQQKTSSSSHIPEQEFLSLVQTVWQANTLGTLCCHGIWTPIPRSSFPSCLYRRTVHPLSSGEQSVVSKIPPCPIRSPQEQGFLARHLPKCLLVSRKLKLLLSTSNPL